MGNTIGARFKGASMRNSSGVLRVRLRKKKRIGIGNKLNRLTSNQRLYSGGNCLQIFLREGIELALNVFAICWLTQMDFCCEGGKDEKLTAALYLK